MVAMSDIKRQKSSSMTRREPGSAQPRQLFRELRHQAKDLGHEIKSVARETTSDLKQEVGRISQAVSDTVKDEAQRLFDERREAVTSKVGVAAKLARQVGHALRAVRLENAAEVADAASEQAQEFGDYLKESDVSQLIEDAEDLTRRHQALVTTGLLVAGFALARFLKASAEANGSNSSGATRRRRGQKARRAGRVSSGDDA
jgi:hypothetical protein